jgi:hypothetical protein
LHSWLNANALQVSAFKADSGLQALPPRSDPR